MSQKITISPPVFKLSDYLTDSEAMVAGVDEVGRGSLFGSVVASAVMLPVKSIVQLEEIAVTDSKKLTPKRREYLVNQIKEIVTDWQITEVDNQTIDQVNILQASLKAMTEAIHQLKPTPILCLIDGKFTLPHLRYPQINLIKGDARSLIIGAASIIAKVWRDQQVIRYAEQFPEYDLASNKGYPTKKHLEALKKYGVSPLHRLSFSPCQTITAI